MNLREKALKGGAFLLLRQALGLCISITGVLLVTRIIGPHQYGLFAAGAGIVTFLYEFATWGIDIYLLRKPGDPEEREFYQAFTLLLIAAFTLCALVIMLRHAIAATLRMPEESSLLILLALSIPINALTVPAVVKLDRSLNFKQVAINELASQVAYYLVAVPIAFSGKGAWAPAAGLLTQQGCLLLLSYCVAALRPRLCWDPVLIRQMVFYGFSYSSSAWVFQLRKLVNPIIVGRFAGASAVGYVAVGARIAALLSFARDATWRLSMPAFAQLNRDSTRLRKAISEGMRFQAVAVGFPLALFALVAPFMIPFGLGHRWVSTVSVYPLIAISCLSISMFTLHSSVLYMLGKNAQVTWFNIVHVILFAGSAVLIVPRTGFIGYGWAELASIPGYFVVHLFLVRAIGKPAYGSAALWCITASLAIVLGSLGVPVLYAGFLVVFAPLLVGSERLTLASYAQVVFSRGHG